jgi:hypothetical protein
VSADPFEETLERFEAATNRLLATCEAMLERIVALEERERELTSDVASLGTQLATVHAQAVGACHLVGERVDSLDERLTTVHRQAIRALTHRTGGDTAA